MFNVRNKDYLTLMDYTPRQIEYLLNLSEDLKKVNGPDAEHQKFRWKNIALIHEKVQLLLF